MTLTVEEAAGGDVDRRYTLQTDRGRVAGTLTLFYRNEVEPFLGAPAENWYREDVAVGGQDDLVAMVDRGRNGQALPSRANPFSNKVVGEGVAATPSGLALHLEERR